MKRSPALRGLSRDHHQALTVALKLRRAKADTMVADQHTFMKFWHGHGQEHFRLEEEILLPAYARHGSLEDPLVVRVLEDHAEIRAAALELERGEDIPPWALRGLGEQLANHVRLEERELFPLIEQTLPATELEGLVDALAQAEQDAGHD